MRRAFGWSVLGTFVLGLSGCGGESSAPVASNPAPVQPASIAPAPVAPVAPPQGTPPAPVAETTGQGGAPASALFPAGLVPGDPATAPPATPGFPPSGTGETPQDAAAPAIPAAPAITTEGAVPGAPEAAIGSPENPGGVEANLPKSYLEASQLALKEGKERDALNLLYAHTLAELKADAPAGANLRWIGALGRPAATIRWGIGVQYTPERGFEGDPPELGKEPKGSEAAGNPGAANTEAGVGGRKRPGNKGTGTATVNAGGGATVNVPSEPKPMLHYFTGELGDKVLERLQKQVAKGVYGDLLKTAAASSPAENEPGANPSPAQPGAVSGGKDAGLGRLSTGLVMLGKGTSKELIERANEEGVELVMIFDVSASKTRTGKESSDTKVRLVDPAAGKDLFTSKNLNNIQLFMAREKPGGKTADPVEDVVELLFKNVEDKNCKLADFPSDLTPEQVKVRYDKLLAQEFENPLPVLVELRHYYKLKLLPGKLLLEGFKKFLGDEKGDLLAKGTLEEKREVLTEWLPAGVKLAPVSAAPPATTVAGSTPPAVGPGVATVGPAVPVVPPAVVPPPAETQPGAVAGPGGAAQKFEIPGTPLSLPVPPGFTLGKDASGSYMVNGSASIRAKREDKSLATALLDYTAENLARGGFTLTEKKEVDALGKKVAIVQAVHTASKLKYMFALLPEGETAVIVVSAGYSAEDEIRLAPALMSAVMSMQLGK